MDQLIAQGSVLNRRWLSLHPEHYLHATWLFKQMQSLGNVFADTCCKVTAEMLRDQLTPGQPWTYACSNPDDIDEYCALDLSMLDLRLCTFFQISQGTCPIDPDHIYSVIEGQIYQSYYRQHPLQYMGPWDGTLPANGHVLVPITN